MPYTDQRRKVVPAHKVFSIKSPAGDGGVYRDVDLKSSAFEPVETIDQADAVLFAAWGAMPHPDDIARMLSQPKPAIFHLTGDSAPVPAKCRGDATWFVVDVHPESNARQFAIPYSYHDLVHLLERGVKFDVRRDELATFRGSLTTHPCRRKISGLKGKDGVEIVEVESWQTDEGAKPALWHSYLESLHRHTFALCPRGKGPSSIRLAEAIYCGAIPVLIGDDTRPFGDPLNFAIRASFDDDMDALVSRLRAMPTAEVEQRRWDMKRFFESMLLADYYRAGSTNDFGCTLWMTERVTETQRTAWMRGPSPEGLQPSATPQAPLP